MADNDYSLFLLEQNKSNKAEDLEYDLKQFKNKEKYKIDKYEIFRPKAKENNLEKEKVLKGAENQVKTLLSNFIKHIQTEKDDSDNEFYKIKSYKKNNDIWINSTRKKSIKNIRTSTNKNYLRDNSNRITNNLLSYKNKNNNNYSYSFKGNKTKAFLSSHSIKKVNFSISPRQKLKKKDSQKGLTNNKFLNFNNINNKIYGNNFQEVSIPKNVNIFHSGKNMKNMNLLNSNSNPSKNDELNRKTLIKKTHSQRQN